ncbi:MAG: S1-C subfamily serine protease [Arenicella sp.]|jgi:S1-C subfamily serine protease
MFKISHLVKTAILSGVVFIATTSTSFAGFSEEELRQELSYLAIQLLDLSGKDSVTVEQPAYMKPFIGICSDLLPEGVKLTCITPGHNASKGGLKTGDLLISVNQIDMTGLSKQDHKNAYFSVAKTMKTGDKLAIKLMRKGQPQSVNVTVGAISHPAYTLTVKKK